MSRTDQEQQRGIGPREIIVLLSFTMALTAISIDLMLPAFGEMRTAFDMDPDASAISRVVVASNPS